MPISRSTHRYRAVSLIYDPDAQPPDDGGGDGGGGDSFPGSDYVASSSPLAFGDVDYDDPAFGCAERDVFFLAANDDHDPVCVAADDTPIPASAPAPRRERS